VLFRIAGAGARTTRQDRWKEMSVSPLPRRSTTYPGEDSAIRSPLSRVTDGVTDALGHEAAFPLAVVAMLAVVIAATAHGVGDTTISTAVSMVTFVMVFALQHTSSRESRALNLKIDELIRVTDARNELIGAEDATHRTLGEKREELLGVREPEPGDPDRD
jgi:low affinity Fe/Cu permease